MIGSTLFFALALAAAPAAPAAAADGGTTLSVALPRPGLYAAAVGFFAATPEPGASEKEIVLRYGDLRTLRIGAGTLPVLDAQVILANASPLTVPRQPVRVSVFLGRVPQANLPPEEEIRPGAPRIQEIPFYDRTYVVKDLAAGGVGRILIPDIQLSEAIREQVRQKIWPVYLRVEARLEEVPPDVEAVQPSVTGFIKLLPR